MKDKILIKQLNFIVKIAGIDIIMTAAQYERYLIYGRI